MNANARKWTEALRSGEYRQGRGSLCTLHNDGESYCCLGVGCDLYQKEHPGYITQDRLDQGRRAYGINRNAALLPAEIAAEWLGLNNSLGAYIKRTGIGTHAGDLIAANDSSRLTFLQIADLIESEPPGLFKESTETSKPEQSVGRSLSPSGARDLVAEDAIA